MCYCLAQLDAQIHARYITSSANTVPDILSHFPLGHKYKQQFEEIKEENWQECEINQQHYSFSMNS